MMPGVESDTLTKVGTTKGGQKLIILIDTEGGRSEKN
jgi:hypothetical protein